jgi:hypothetical protein
MSPLNNFIFWIVVERTAVIIFSQGKLLMLKSIPYFGDQQAMMAEDPTS